MTTAPSPARAEADRRLLRTGAVLAALVGVIHLVGAGGFLQQTPYLGVLFLLGGLGPVAAAVAMLTPRFAGLRRLAVALTALACALMLVMGVISRVTPLPGTEQTGGWGPLFVLALVLEAAFLALTPRLLAATR